MQGQWLIDRNGLVGENKNPYAKHAFIADGRMALFKKLRNVSIGNGPILDPSEKGTKEVDSMNAIIMHASQAVIEGRQRAQVVGISNPESSVSSAHSSAGAGPFEAIVIIAIIAAAIGLAIYFIKKNQSKHTPSYVGSHVNNVTRYAPTPGRSCATCGAAIPSESQFCPKCGAPQNH